MARADLPPSVARHIRRAAWSMAMRVVTALVGGYAAAAALTTLIARLLPIARVEAATWGLMLSFVPYAVLGLWCFHEPRLARAAAVTWGIALVAGGLCWWLGVRA